MNHQEESASITALSDCMDALGLSRRIRSHKVIAEVKPQGHDLARGQIEISFDLLDLSNGPEINCESDIMRSFGIQHGNFKPWFQKFSFKKEAMELQISSDHPKTGYEFTFCF